MSTRPPRIGIDCRFAETLSGIGRYTRELVAALKGRKDPWEYVFLHPPIPHYSLREQWEMPRVIQEAQLDLLHVPHFNIPIMSPVPLVATIHDLTLHRFPNEASLPKRLAYRLLMGRTVKHAAAIIAVSRATADDLATQYGNAVGAKTTVIHEGVSAEFRPAPEEEKRRVRRAYHLPERFALYVGNAKEHKSVQRLIEACPPDLPLLLVTGGKEVTRLRLREHTRVLAGVPDGDLPALYSAASVFVSPSLLEGFNLPVLEAMACGCPVIAVARGSTPEVAGEHAVLIEPTPEALRRALANAGMRNADAAIAHARSFTWERMAERTAKVYAEALPWTP